MQLDLTEHWQFTQHPSYFETQSSVMKSMDIVQRAIPISDFVGDQPKILFVFWGVVEALTHQDDNTNWQFCR